MSAQEIWAWVVSGESGGGWEQGSALVAWTLRAWQVYLGMPPGMAGPRWGWYGWSVPNTETRLAVQEAWGQDPHSAPFAFMKEGKFCRALGNAQDGVYWKEIGWHPQGPDFALVHPVFSRYVLNCYWQAP